MRRSAIALGLLIAIPAGLAIARRPIRFHDDDIGGFRGFSVSGRLGTEQKAMATAAHLAGNRISVLPNGGALVIDADSGKLLRTDETSKSTGMVEIGHDAGLMTYDADANVAYVADRHGDRIAVVKLGDKLSIERAFKTPAEPYGVALSPDRKLLLVTTIADRTLVAFDTATGKEKWRTQLGREPRGIAISADGARAVVAYLTTGTVDQIDLRAAKPSLGRVAISTQQLGSRRRADGSGESFARGSFTVAFMGATQAVVPFQRETPVQITNGRTERVGTYGGGGFEPPVSHQVAFVGFDKDLPRQHTANIAQHQTRAIAWDGENDALYLAGLGNDTVLQLRNASQSTLAEGITLQLGGGGRCGPDGIAVTKTGDLVVWCAFTRNVKRVKVVADGKLAAIAATKVDAGPTLTGSRMTTKQHLGFVAFHAAESTVSQGGAMACSTCHPDNRTDGLSWRIDKHELQTPILAGRMVGTHPFKWDGGDKDLRTSLTMTMKRLGGTGLDEARTSGLQAYVEMLPNVRAPRREATSVARGKQLFDSAEVGCRQCHDGPTYADNQKHKMSGSLPDADTPSLLGLAASAPYYHDGSAPTLESVLRDRGAVHGMSDVKLTDAQVTDLVAFLETL